MMCPSRSRFSSALHRAFTMRSQLRTSMKFSPLLQAVLLLGSFIASMEASEHKAALEQSALDKRTLSYYLSPMDVFNPLEAYNHYYPSGAMAALGGDESSKPDKRGIDDGSMPGVLRFGKRAQSFVRFGRSGDWVDDDRMLLMMKKEMPGVLRFGKRSSGAVPGVLRFGKRDIDSMPGVLRFGKRDGEIPGVLRFGKRDIDSMPGVLRFGKRDIDSMPGVLRFGKRDIDSMPGVLRFGKRPSPEDIPGVLRFGRRSVPGVLRFGRK